MTDKLTANDIRQAEAQLSEAAKKFTWKIFPRDCGCVFGCGIKPGNDFASFEHAFCQEHSIDYVLDGLEESDPLLTDSDVAERNEAERPSPAEKATE